MGTSLTHLVASGVDLPRLLLLLVGSLFGTVLGSKATMVIPDQPPQVPDC